ncbi:MAG: hypothetical protein ACE5KC_01630 [Candidatus Bathyarchaeia archaeon]
MQKIAYRSRFPMLLLTMTVAMEMESAFLFVQLMFSIGQILWASCVGEEV